MFWFRCTINRRGGSVERSSRTRGIWVGSPIATDLYVYTCTWQFHSRRSVKARYVSGPSPVMITSPYERNILEEDEKYQTEHQTNKLTSGRVCYIQLMIMVIKATIINCEVFATPADPDQRPSKGTLHDNDPSVSTGLDDLQGCLQWHKKMSSRCLTPCRRPIPMLNLL